MGNLFKNTIAKTPQISGCYKAGISALGSNKEKVMAKNTRLLLGSIDLDTCLKRIFPNQNRWDYIVCYNKDVYFIEVHPVKTGEINTVLKKLEWLAGWLKQNATEIKKLEKTPYYWAASGSVNISPVSPQYKKLSKHGIKIVERVELR